MKNLLGLSKIKLLIAMTFGYGSFYILNNYLTKGLYIAPGAHIIHLPSGVKMLLVLISGMLGSIAITIVAFSYGMLNSFSHNYALVLSLAILSGMIPLASLFLLNKFLKLSNDLSNLNWEKLLLISLTFAILNSLSHQLVIYAYGESHDLFNGFLIMFTGDVTGIFIILYLFRFVLKIAKANKN